MNKIQTIEALLRLSKDKSTTKAERDAAKAAIKALTGNESNSNTEIIQPTSSNIEVAKFKMPPWIHGDIQYAYGKIERLANRLCFDNSRRWHESLYRYEVYRKDCESQFQRDGFRFRIYGGLGFQNIWVMITDTKESLYTWDRQDERSIQIYDGHRTGWRDGPWWDKLDKVIDKWIVEADALDVEIARQAAMEKQAEIDKQNDIFTKYMKKQ